jgi:hypothetical protein
MDWDEDGLQTHHEIAMLLQSGTVAGDKKKTATDGFSVQRPMRPPFTCTRIENNRISDASLLRPRHAMVSVYF